ncbi:HAMP domain-containing protein [bacterium]|nr:HAMP domain-containing protein [bacterium]
MLGIRAKIVLPFTGLFAVTILAVALLAARGTARVVEERFQAQMPDRAAVLSQAGFAANAHVLAKVGALVGGELATVDAGGAILATTLGARESAALARSLESEPPGEDPTKGTRRLELEGLTYRAAFAPIKASHWHAGRAFICLLIRESEIQAAAADAARPILVAAAFGMVAVVAFGVLVGRAIARPVQSLAEQARRLAAGGGGELAAPTGDEVGELAAAFNDLLTSLREAEAKVVAGERLAAVGQVAAGIAHEVRNPLSGIKMSAQLLGRRVREVGASDGGSVDVMLAEIARLEIIIDDLLTFAGPTRLTTEPTCLNAVVGGVLDFMARQLEHSGVRVVRELDAAAPAAPLDPRRVRQVVLNLVLNAAEAMPEGGCLTVRTRGADDEVTAEFCDTGHGVDAEAAERLFDPFFTTKRGGSGLGLGVSRTIVEAHGGRIEFENLNPGARFTFTIPRRADG